MNEINTKNFMPTPFLFIYTVCMYRKMENSESGGGKEDKGSFFEVAQDVLF